MESTKVVKQKAWRKFPEKNTVNKNINEDTMNAIRTRKIL